MKTLSRLFLIVLLLANVGFMAMVSLHVVKGPSGTAVVAKTNLTLVDSYIDVTSWKDADKDIHAAFVSRVNAAGKSYLLSHVGQTGVSQAPAPSPKVLPNISASINAGSPNVTPAKSVEAVKSAAETVKKETVKTVEKVTEPAQKSIFPDH